jgi:hypothetical protein
MMPAHFLDNARNIPIRVLCVSIYKRLNRLATVLARELGSRESVLRISIGERGSVANNLFRNGAFELPSARHGLQ